MNKTTTRIFFSFLAVIIFCGFMKLKTDNASSITSLQPKNERSAQDKLPKAKDALWDTLYNTIVKLDKKTGTYSVVFPDEVRKLSGQTIKISGFILPLESSKKFKHFLLSKRTPTCFFCPPGAPNEIIEVYSDKETGWAEDLVTYEGKFELTENKEMGIFFKMTAAIKK